MGISLSIPFESAILHKNNKSAPKVQIYLYI